MLFLQLVAAPRAARVGGLAAAAVCGLGLPPGEDLGVCEVPGVTCSSLDDIHGCLLMRCCV